MRISDWSSDVCSSDLLEAIVEAHGHDEHHRPQLFPFGFTAIPKMLVQQTSLDTLAKRDDFLARLSLLPAHLQAGLDLLQNGFRRGYRLPRALRPRILAMIDGDIAEAGLPDAVRSEEHTSELQSLMRISYAVFCLKKKR